MSGIDAYAEKLRSNKPTKAGTPSKPSSGLIGVVREIRSSPEQVCLYDSDDLMSEGFDVYGNRTPIFEAARSKPFSTPPSSRRSKYDTNKCLFQPEGFVEKHHTRNPQQNEGDVNALGDLGALCLQQKLKNLEGAMNFWSIDS